MASRRWKCTRGAPSVVHLKMLDFPGFFWVAKGWTFHLQVLDFPGGFVWRVHLKMPDFPGFFYMVHLQSNRLPSQPRLLAGAKDCQNERRTGPNSELKWTSTKDSIWVVGALNPGKRSPKVQKIASKRARRFQKLVLACRLNAGKAGIFPKTGPKW